MESQYETFKDIIAYNENEFLLCIMRQSKRSTQSSRFIVMARKKEETTW